MLLFFAMVNCMNERLNWHSEFHTFLGSYVNLKVSVQNGEVGSTECCTDALLFRNACVFKIPDETV
jgi:hypothetical protein